MQSCSLFHLRGVTHELLATSYEIRILMNIHLALSAIILGLVSIVLQVALLREFFVTFQGDELSWGFVLASWLVWTGTGALIAGRTGPASRVPHPVSLLRTWAILPLLIATSLIATRTLRSILGVMRGEIFGPGQMTLSALLLLALPCLALGALFTLTNKAWKTNGGAAGWIYCLESCGCLLGGLFAYFLSYQLTMPVLISLLSLFCFIPVLLTSRQHGIRDTGHGTRRRSSSYWLIPLLLAATFLIFSPQIHKWSVEKQWPHENIIAYRNTPYGNITVGRENSQLNFFLSGALAFSIPGGSNNDELFHLPLLHHPAPREILIIGGGLSGGLNNILQHTPQRIDYVELDGELFCVAERVLPASDLQALSDPVVYLHATDGRAFLRGSGVRDQGSGQAYDLILINAGPPTNAAANRYYTSEFFQLAKRRLKENGIISIRIPFSEEYLGAEMRLLGSSILRALEKHFPYTLLLPREDALLLASPQPFAQNTESLLERMTERHISSPALGRKRLGYLLDTHRSKRAKAMLAGGNANHDLRPVSFLYNLALQASQHGRKMGSFYLSLKERYQHLVFLLPLLLFTPLTFKRRQRSIPHLTSVILVTAGFTGLSLEIICLLSMQSLTGMAYSKLAVLVSFFMLGMSIGSGLFSRRTAYTKKNATPLLGALLALSLVLPLVLSASGKWSSFTLEFFYYVYVSCVGYVAGALFPVSLALIPKKDREQTAGRAYAADVTGAALGALLTGAFLVPVLGIAASCLSIALLVGITLLAVRRL